MTALESWFEEIGCIHRSAGNSAGSYNRMNLIDKENDIFPPLELRNHGLQTLLKITPVAGTGKQAPHIERKDRIFAQHFWHGAIGDPRGKSLGHGCLSNTRITDKNRIVFEASAEDLYTTLEDILSPDQWFEFPLFRGHRKVAGELGERVFLFPLLFCFAFSFLGIVRFFIHGIFSFAIRTLEDSAMGYNFQEIIPGNAVFL